ncbi:MAG TPA: septum formation family protein [Streptosporangiaceae bacterium]|nr:septum formation family protein [Streptosporangiaceae bacterium]
MSPGRGTDTPAEHASAEAEHEPADPAGTEPAGAEPGGPGPAGTDPAGTDPAGAGPGAVAAGTGTAGPEAVPPGPHRHRRWVTASLVVLIIIVLVAAGGGVAALLTHGFHSKTTVKYRQAAIFSVKTGDCIDLTTSGTTVHVVACTDPHDAEIFGTFQLGGAWPGDSSARQQAASGCESRLSSYLNPQLATSNLTQSYVYPGQQAWVSGQHTVVCEVRSTSGQLNSSVRRG